MIDDHERGVTEQVFGTYVSVYDFQHAVADGATLPLYYENRGKKLRIVDEELNRRIEERIDAARQDGELTVEQEEKLYRELAREYPVLTADTRLNDVAADFVEHYHQRWRLMESPAKAGELTQYGGNAKAMLVCLDKVTCAKMAKLIKAKWDAQRLVLLAKLQDEEARYSNSGKPETPYVHRLRAQVIWMAETQIHPVFSHEQGEIQEFQAEDIDVGPLRDVIKNGIGGKSIEKCFQDGKHPFRVAVVCAMWLTGFDVKSLATLYLDKPMKGHTLMQAIARVNRVAAHKKNGLVIGYNGTIKSLREAMATYAQSDKGRPIDPLLDEDQALLEYADAIARVEANLISVGYKLDVLIQAQEGNDSWEQLLVARNAISKTEETKKTFLVLAEDVFDRFRGLFPNQGLFKYEPQENAIAAIYNLLQRPGKKIDISNIMQEIRGVIDMSLDVTPHNQTNQAAKQYDLSGIDFERLRLEFAKSPYKEAAVLSLQERIQARLDLMMRANPTRIDLYQRYQDIIAEYNRDKDDAEIQRVFDKLMKVHESLDEEERRYIREGFSSEKELTIFDLLSKDLATKADLVKVKKVAKELMAIVEKRRNEMGDLKQRAAVQAQMMAAIIDGLAQSLPESFSNDEINARAAMVYQYVEQDMRGTLH